MLQASEAREGAPISDMHESCLFYMIHEACLLYMIRESCFSYMVRLSEAEDKFNVASTLHGRGHKTTPST